ncbi:MAG: GspE/PulE family protein [Vibrio sp.]
MSSIFLNEIDSMLEKSLSYSDNGFYFMSNDNKYKLCPISSLASKFNDRNEVVGQFLFMPDEAYNSVLEKYNYLKEEALNKSHVELDIYNIMLDAISVRTSDIHFIRDDSGAYIRFRSDGSVDTYKHINNEHCDELLFVLYNVMASTKETTWNVKTPQDANISLDIRGDTYRFRYAHMPIFSVSGSSSGCYHAVIRIIYPNKVGEVCLELSKIGYDDKETELVEKMISNPSGLIIVSGVTGSGKSTTLKSLMEYLYFLKYREKGCFISVEDPVEYFISGTQQSSVTKSKTENLFAEAVRSAMRRDPDVLMIGEVRDVNTGRALSGAVESGHLCLSTVHAGNCVGVLQRLFGLGIPLDKLATPGFIAGIMNQKLIPKLCPSCKKRSINIYGREVYTANLSGCDKCSNKGFLGRILVVEFLIPDLDALKLTLEQKWVDIYLNIKNNRSDVNLTEGYSLKEKIYYKTLTGETCSDAFYASYGKLENSHDEHQIYSIYKASGKTQAL